MGEVVEICRKKETKSGLWRIVFECQHQKRVEGVWEQESCWGDWLIMLDLRLVDLEMAK
jgi:hypothetical protein